MDELVDEFSGLLAYRTVGVDVHIGGLGKIRNPAWARVAAPHGRVSRSRSAGSAVGRAGHFLAAVSVEVVESVGGARRGRDGGEGVGSQFPV